MSFSNFHICLFTFWISILNFYSFVLHSPCFGFQCLLSGCLVSVLSTSFALELSGSLRPFWSAFDLLWSVLDLVAGFRLCLNHHLDRFADQLKNLGSPFGAVRSGNPTDRRVGRTGVICWSLADSPGELPNRTQRRRSLQVKAGISPKKSWRGELIPTKFEKMRKKTKRQFFEKFDFF